MWEERGLLGFFTFCLEFQNRTGNLPVTCWQIQITRWDCSVYLKTLTLSHTLVQYITSLKKDLWKEVCSISNSHSYQCSIESSNCVFIILPFFGGLILHVKEASTNPWEVVLQFCVGRTEEPEQFLRWLRPLAPSPFIACLMFFLLLHSNKNKKSLMFLTKRSLLNWLGNSCLSVSACSCSYWGRKEWSNSFCQQSPTNHGKVSNWSSMKPLRTVVL